MQHSGRVNARQIHGILQCSATHSNAGLEARRQVLTGPLWRDVSSPVRIVVSHTMGRKAQPPPTTTGCREALSRHRRRFPALLPCLVLSCESNCFSFFCHSRTRVHVRTNKAGGAPAAAPCLRGSAVHSRACVQPAQLVAANSRLQHCNKIFSINLGPRGKWCGEGEWSGRLGPTDEATARAGCSVIVMAW